MFNSVDKDIFREHEILILSYNRLKVENHNLTKKLYESKGIIAMNEERRKKYVLINN